MPTVDENPYYEDPAFYQGINEGIFAAIDGIWDLVDRGNGAQGQNYQQAPPPQDLKPLYIGFGVLGVFMLIILVAIMLKK